MKPRVVFFLQPTISFPNGPPERIDYKSDLDFKDAILDYADEWRRVYTCIGCKAPDCPQHGYGRKISS